MHKDLNAARERMVERQLAARGIRDPRLLAAMREVPREAFVPENLREFATTTTRCRSVKGRRSPSLTSLPK